MTGKTIVAILLMCTTAAYAGDGKRVTLFFNFGANYQLNQTDVVNETALHEPLTTTNTIGTQAGAEAFWNLPGRIFFAAGIDYRNAPQQINIVYKASEAGFGGSTVVHQEQISYTSHYITPNARFGYSFPAGRSKLDFSLGLASNIAVSGKWNENEGITALNITGSDYTDLAMYTDERWGHKSDYRVLPINTIASLQLAYRLRIGRAAMRFALDFSSGTGTMLNRTTVNYFGPGRTQVGHSIFSDKFQSLGFIVGVGI